MARANSENVSQLRFKELLLNSELIFLRRIPNTISFLLNQSKIGK